MIGAGPLRIRVGNLQTQGEDGVSTGHFVLLQSWLPIEENLEKRMPFPFGVGACSTSTVHQSPDSSASASASTPFAEQHQPEASATAAVEPSVASNASAAKANVHRLLAQEQTQTVQGTKRKHQDLEEGRPSVSKSGRSSAKNAATNAPLLDDIIAKQRRTHAEITTTETDGASAKIQQIEEGSSLSSAAALNVQAPDNKHIN